MKLSLLFVGFICFGCGNTWEDTDGEEENPDLVETITDSVLDSEYGSETSTEIETTEMEDQEENQELECPEGFDTCGGNMCVMLGTPSNCSGCGDVCAPGDFCCDGVCGGSTAENCGWCGNICPDGNGCCDGVCIPLGTESNCGNCGDACEAGEDCCVADGIPSCTRIDTTNDCGSCGNQCTDGQTCCFGFCMNDFTTVNNCGSCGNICESGMACCPPGGVHTNNYCASLDTTINCGTCGNVCSGACCGGSCVDISTNSNCGSCNNVCLDLDGGGCEVPECISGTCGMVPDDTSCMNGYYNKCIDSVCRRSCSIIGPIDQCYDGNDCNEENHCDVSAGYCVFYPPPTCNDADSSTVDYCCDFPVGIESGPDNPYEAVWECSHICTGVSCHTHYYGLFRLVTPAALTISTTCTFDYIYVRSDRSYWIDTSRNLALQIGRTGTFDPAHVIYGLSPITGQWDGYFPVGDNSLMDIHWSNIREYATWIDICEFPPGEWWLGNAYKVPCVGQGTIPGELCYTGICDSEGYPIYSCPF